MKKWVQGYQVRGSIKETVRIDIPEQVKVDRARTLEKEEQK